MTDTYRSIPALQALLSDGAAAHSTNRQLIRDMLVSLDRANAINVRRYLAFDGTDETTAFNALLLALYNANGGTLVFPAGATLRIDGAVVFPNDGGTIPKQPSMRLSGEGATTHAGQTITPFGGFTLDLRYNGGVAQLDTRGLGGLEIDHITFLDNGGTTTPFIQTTNTTVFIHHNRFNGPTAQSGLTCTKDAIIGGGTRPSSSMGGDSDSCFQGYGSVIEKNCFSKIRRGVYARTACNDLNVNQNWFLHNCGSNLSDGAAIEFLGTNTDGCSSPKVFWNTIEVGAYPYGVKAEYSVLGNYGPNGFFDPGIGIHLAAYRFELHSTSNLVTDGFRVDTFPIVSDVSGSSTVLTSHSSQPSIWPQPQKWTNLSSKFANSSSFGPATEDISGNDWFHRIVTAGTGEKYYLAYKAAAGSTEDHFYWWRVDANTGQMFFVGTGSHAIKSDSGSITLDSLDSTKFIQVGGTAKAQIGAPGSKVSFFGGGGAVKQTVTGAKGGNAALGSLIAALVAHSLITDTTTA